MNSYRLRVILTSVAACGLTSSLAASTDVAAANDAARRSVPVIASVAPAAPTVSDDPQQVTVSGEDFLPGLTLEVTRPDSGTVTLQADDIVALTPTSFVVSLMLDRPGDYVLRVTNTDGGMSEPFVLAADVDATPEPPAPVITSVTPSEPVRAPQPQTLRVDGEHFDPALRVIVTNPMGQEVIDTSLSDLTETSFDLRVLLDQSGNYELVVHNPSGRTSNVITIVVQ